MQPRTEDAAPPRNRKTSSSPNLLISIDERHRALAESEVAGLLRSVGVQEYAIMPVDEGLLGIQLNVDDPKRCIERLQATLREDPLRFQHTHRWVPVEAWVEAEPVALRAFGRRVQDEIGPDESWRIDVHRHHSPVDRGLVITALADGIDNPNVDLDHATKHVSLDLVGGRAAVSILDAGQELRVDRTIAKEFLRFEEE